MQKNTNIGDRISKSLLLTDDRKARLTGLLPTLNPAEMEELCAILSKESALPFRVAEKVIRTAVRDGAQVMLDELMKFVALLLRPIRKIQESIEHGDDKNSLDDFFETKTT